MILLTAFITLCLFGYLITAMVRPEKF